MLYILNNQNIELIQRTLNKKLEVVIPIEYYEIKTFTSNSFRICKAISYWEHLWGIIDKFGKIILPIEYREIGTYTERKAKVNYKGDIGHIDSNGHVLCENVQDISGGYSCGSKFGKWGVELNGEEILPYQYSDITFWGAGSLVRIKSGNRVGIYDLKSGTFVVPFGDYSQIDILVGGSATVTTIDDEEGAIDMFGKRVPDQINPLDSDCFAFRLFGLWGLQDKEGHILIEAKYDSLSALGIAGYYVAAVEHGNIVIDKCGMEVISNPAQRFVLQDAFVLAVYSEHMCLFNQELQQIEGKYYRDSVKPLGNTGLYMAVAFVDDVYLKGILRTDGTVALSFEYSELIDWGNNLLLAKREGLMGVIDLNGNTVVPFDFIKIGQLDNENKAAVVNRDGSRGFINSEGKAVFERIVPINDTMSKKLLLGKWGIYDSSNQKVCEEEFSEIGNYAGFVIGVTADSFTLLKSIPCLDCSIDGVIQSKNSKGIIWSIGGHMAKMNKNQIKKSKGLFVYRKGLRKSLYLTGYNELLNLLYVSCVKPKYIPPKAKVLYNYEVGESVSGEIIKTTNGSIRVKLDNGDMQVLFLSILESQGLTLDMVDVGQRLRLIKTGYDDINNKHIWKIELLS